jgi:CDP-diacylglycerol--serine O-phosphatidyltransferase
MSIEGRWELALALVVFAALLDGVDGRVARLLKASSRFGAELDSLADFVNFGVAPAFLLFTWGLAGLKGAGWICVMIFALAAGLRLARFNVAIDEDRPKWQSDFFTGMPTPAAAIVVLLPVYLDNLGFDGFRLGWGLYLVLVYTLVIAFMMVSEIPTYSGKLLGERIGREFVLPIFVLAVALVALLLTYPYATLTWVSLIYLAMIPLAWRVFARKLRETEPGALPAASQAEPPEAARGEDQKPPAPTQPGAAERRRVLEMRATDPKR